MSELKTLKDFEKEEFYQEDLVVTALHEIKQEAIKWVKFQEDIQNHNLHYANEYRLNIQWIKNFFSITEDELTK